YSWSLELTVTATDKTLQTKTFRLATSGSTPILVGNKVNWNYGPIFGSGWQLDGVPSFFVDQRSTAKTEDDRVLIHFPGSGFKVFDAGLLTVNNYNYAGILESMRPGSSRFDSNPDRYEHDPLEFGSLTAKTAGTNKLLDYRAGDGTEYIAKQYEITDPVDNLLKKIYLIDRIEQPGVDMASSAPGRRGLNFVWNTSGTFPRLQSFTASDNTTTTLKYTGDTVTSIDVGSTTNNYVLTYVPGRAGEAPRWASIREANATTNSALTSTDAFREFRYDDAG
ncbi:MAG: hypothetical protein ACK53L_09280, partial [Pirellulaceae bacterium]